MSGSASRRAGLPAYSVAEGLLAGNVNILKLPSMDQGASILLLKELTDLEPRLRDYVYVFDVPSTDLESLTVFARAADAVVVWGGDEAVRAARRLADPVPRGYRTRRMGPPPGRRRGTSSGPSSVSSL